MLTQSQIRAWSTEHLTNAATYWSQTADQWEDVFLTMRNQSHAIGWLGAGGDGLRQRTGSDLTTVSTKADQLRQAAGVARSGASDISSAKQRVLFAIEDPQNAGFDVGEDLSVSYTDHGGSAAQQAARQAQAEQMASEIWSRAEQLEGVDSKVAGQITSAASDVGNVSFASGSATSVPAHNGNGNGVQLVDFKQDGGPGQPVPPQPPSIKIQPHPNPPAVINAHVGETPDPSKHHCGPGEIAKDTTIAVGGAAGIASGVAGEAPSLGGTTALILGGVGALWDGMDKLGECE